MYSVCACQTHLCFSLIPMCTKGNLTDPASKLARKRAYDVMDPYTKRFATAVLCLENSSENSLAFCAFSKLDVWKNFSYNMIES